MTMVSVPRVIWPVISLLTVRPFLSPLLFSVAKGMEVRKIRVLGTMPTSSTSKIQIDNQILKTQ